MKVALSNPRRTWGGASSMTVLLAEGLIERGDEVVALTRKGGSQLEDRLRGLVPVEPILTGRDFPPPSIVRTLRVLRRERPDILVSATSTDLRFAPPAAKLLGVPVLARREALFPLTYHTRFDQWLWRHVTDHMVANSEATRRVLLESAPWLTPDGVTVIHNGIPVDRFRSAEPATLPVPEGALTIGFVGRLAVEKGLPDLVAAWPMIRDAEPRAHLVLVGDGSEREWLERDLGGDPRVRLLGYRSDVPEILKALDIFVLPSHSEAFGIAAAEAMAAGRPVVATTVGGLTEVIQDGETGRLVPPHSPDRLAAAVLDLARDPSLRRRLGDAAARDVADRFDNATVVDRYRELLARIVARGNGPSK